ncbi:hypothetical protein [Pontitalea aquivivens]|uniref:hypothetical protein n=1 Tax=Pontitalea aquivivens TaxID=3388663 RepID=UPI003970485E
METTFPEGSSRPNMFYLFLLTGARGPCGLLPRAIEPAIPRAMTALAVDPGGEMLTEVLIRHFSAAGRIKVLNG